MITLLDRYIATLFGLHIGDAIWAPYETKPASAIPALLGPRGLRFHKYENPWPEDRNGKMLPAGRPTDDSDQAADLCHSLLECNGIDQEHLRWALQNSVVHGHSRLWKGTATGAGKTTRAMLGDDPTKYEHVISTPLASNGSLMRSAPLALFLSPSPTRYSKSNGVEYAMVKAMSEVTHIHPDSVAACWFFVRMVRNALAERRFDEIEIQDQFDLRVCSYLVEVENGAGLPEDPGSFKDGWGAAEYSLKVALHAVMTTESFQDCIRTVGLAGGDTDTYGAIAGALVGAIYGTKAIPRQWENTILGKKPMQHYGKRLHETRMTTAN